MLCQEQCPSLLSPPRRPQMPWKHLCVHSLRGHCRRCVHHHHHHHRHRHRHRHHHLRRPHHHPCPRLQQDQGFQDPTPGWACHVGNLRMGQHRHRSRAQHRRRHRLGCCHHERHLRLRNRRCQSCRWCR